MLPESLLRMIRRLTLKTRRTANERLAGAYESAMRGAGLTFSDIRPYEPGDDARRIDWNVTARTGLPHIKTYVEERERVVWLLADASASMAFAPPRSTKRATIAEVAALIAFAAAANGDRVGLLVFTNCLERVLLPKKGDRHARRVARELFGMKPRDQGTSLTGALSAIRKRRRALVFLLSDFQDNLATPAIRVAARRHELVAVNVGDPLEFELPRVGLMRMSDAERGGELLIDTEATEVRAHYRAMAVARQTELRNLLKSAGAEQVDVTTAGGHLEALLAFFRRRERKR